MASAEAACPSKEEFMAFFESIGPDELSLQTLHDAPLSKVYLLAYPPSEPSTPYILKRIHQYPAGTHRNLGQFRSFLTEASTLDALRKIPALAPFLPSICWSALHKLSAYILQRYEPVVTVDELLRKRKKLDFTLGWNIISNLTIGLNALHDAGYLHRDLHPGNILIRTTPGPLAEYPIFIDFGLACKTPCTETGRVGAAHYIPQNWYTGLERQNRGFSKRANLGIPRPLKAQPNALPARYTYETDSYSLSVVVEQMKSLLNMDGTEEERAFKKGQMSVLTDHIHDLKRRVLPNLAATRAAMPVAANRQARLNAFNTAQTKRNRNLYLNEQRHLAALAVAEAASKKARDRKRGRGEGSKDPRANLAAALPAVMGVTTRSKTRRAKPGNNV